MRRASLSPVSMDPGLFLLTEWMMTTVTAKMVQMSQVLKEIESGDAVQFSGIMEMVCITVVYVCPQAPLLVQMVASIAPMLVTGPCLSHPPVLMMASVVRWLCIWTFLLSSVRWMEWYCIWNLSSPQTAAILLMSTTAEPNVKIPASEFWSKCNRFPGKSTLTAVYTWHILVLHCIHVHQTDVFGHCDASQYCTKMC